MKPVKQRRRRRLPFIVGLLLGLFIFYNTFEFRRTAFTCKTFWSCIGLGGPRHRYTGKRLDAGQQTYSEVTLNDGTIRYDRKSGNSHPETLFLVLNRDASSWSSDFRSSTRTVHDLLDLLVSTNLDLTTVSLALMTASPEEYKKAIAATQTMPLARTTVMYRQDPGTGISYDARHSRDPKVQLARRGRIATFRNYLMLSALDDEKHIVWLDADVVELSSNVIQSMINGATSSPDAGIITVACHQNQMDNFDKNAWRVNSPALMDVIPDTARAAAVRDLVKRRYFIPELIQNAAPDELVPLDSVGGTILYIRAHLVRQGLSFPHYNIVGTTWSNTGWVGVETEGICYAARGLEGGGCYVLAGNHHARHTDWG